MRQRVAYFAHPARLLAIGTLEDVTCTFTNEAQGSLTIAKDTVPDQPTNFAYLATGFNVTEFALDDATNDDLDGVPGQREFVQLPDGRTVTVTELVQFGFSLDSLACTGATASVVVIDAVSARVTVTIANGEHVVCTFTNVDTDADNDGLTDDLERLFGTDPNNPDTDGDGVPDGEELFVNATDPRDATNGEGVDGTAVCVSERGFAAPIAPTGSTLAKSCGGTVQELIEDLRDAGANSATFTVDGVAVVLVATELTFVNEAFFDVFFDIDVDLDTPADHGVDSFFDLEIPPCTLVFVRSLN
jgi:hypothetical protein